MKNINQLKAGALLSYINLGLGCIIPLLYTPIMLRTLGQAEYGLYSLSNSIISYLSMLNFGMGSAVMRYVTKCRAEGDKRGVENIIGLFTIIYSILAVLVIIFGVFLSVFANTFFSRGLSGEEISRLRVLLILMTLSTAVSFPVSVFSSIVVAYEKYIFRRVIDIAGTVLLPVFNLIALFMGTGSVGMAVVGLIIQILYAPIFLWFNAKILNIFPRFGKPQPGLLKEIWGFSAFVFLSMIVDLLYWSTDKVLIGAMVGSVAVAIYNVGGTFTSMLQNMSSAISNVFVPRVTMMVVKEVANDEISELLIRIGRLQYLVISLMLSGYIVFGRIFIHFWSGDAYEDAYWIALLTMIPLTIPLIQNIAYNTILAQKKHQFRAIIYAIIAIINVVSTYLVLPHYGIIGAAVCTGIAFMVGNGIIMNIYYYKVTKLNIGKFWKNIGQMTIIPAVLVIAGYWEVNCYIPVKGITRFLVEVIIYTLVFCGLSWKITMNQYEKNLFCDLIKKLLRIKDKGNVL